MSNRVKIATNLFLVKNENTGESMCFEHFLDEKDHAFICEEQTGKELFKFDSSCRMTNTKGTLIGTIRLEDINLEKWAFYTVNFVDGKVVTEKVLDLKARYPFAGEPEIIKWLVETNQLEIFKQK